MLPSSGKPIGELKGDDAIEAELVTRLEDLDEHYRPRVLLEILTLGVVEGWGKVLPSP